MRFSTLSDMMAYPAVFESNLLEMQRRHIFATQQCSGLHASPTHIPHISHRLHVLGECIPQAWHRHLRCLWYTITSAMLSK